MKTIYFSKLPSLKKIRTFFHWYRKPVYRDNMNLYPESFEFYCSLKNHKNGRNLTSQICPFVSGISQWCFFCCVLQSAPTCGTDTAWRFVRQISQQPFLAFWVSRVTLENSWTKFHLVRDSLNPLCYVQREDKGSSRKNTEQDAMWPHDYSCFENNHPECRFQ